MSNFLRIGTDNDPRREQWIRETLKKIPEGSRILDAGAGQRRFKPDCAHLIYVAQDFGKYNGQGDGVGLQTGTWDQSDLDIVSDITAIPVEDGSFDAVMCIEVFEHLPDPLAALAEFARILKPGGHLILTAPFASGTHFAPYYFYTGFSRYFYEHHLAHNGFAILELGANGNFFEYIAQEVRRIPFMATKYAGWRLSWVCKLVYLPLLLLLNCFARHDNGSSEFSAFGYNVFSIKK